MTPALSNAQRAILVAAGSTPERLVEPGHVALRGGAVAIVLRSLVKRRLLSEVLAGEGDPVWWNSEAGNPLVLRVSDAGLEAAGLASAQSAVVKPSDEPKTTRQGTKQAMLISLLQRPEGATIDEMVAATGWLSHTVRGAMAGALKKRLGMTIGSEKVEGRGRVYRAA